MCLSAVPLHVSMSITLRASISDAALLMLVVGVSQCLGGCARFEAGMGLRLRGMLEARSRVGTVAYRNGQLENKISTVMMLIGARCNDGVTCCGRCRERVVKPACGVAASSARIHHHTSNQGLTAMQTSQTRFQHVQQLTLTVHLYFAPLRVPMGPKEAS